MLYFYLLQDFGSRFWRLTIAVQSRLSRMLRKKTPTWTGCISSRARRPPSPMRDALTVASTWETKRSIASLTNRDRLSFVRWSMILGWYFVRFLMTIVEWYRWTLAKIGCLIRWFLLTKELPQPTDQVLWIPTLGNAPKVCFLLGAWLKCFIDTF